MRSIADDAEILSRLISIQKLVKPLTTPLTTLVTADGDIDDPSLAFAKAGFSASKYNQVGEGLRQCVYQIDSIPADAAPIPLKVPLLFAHAEDEVVSLLNDINLGYIEEGSATESGSSSTASVGAANANGKIWQSAPEMGDMGISWGQRAYSLENVLSQYGIDESHVRGDGTAGDPYRALVHPDNIGTQRDYAYLLTGLYKNNKVCNLLLLNPVPTITVNSAFGAKNNPAVVTVGCMYTHKALWVE